MPREGKAVESESKLAVFWGLGWKRGMTANQLQEFFFKFIYLFWQRERAGEGQRERHRERQRIPSRLWVISAEPDTGLHLTSVIHEITTWADIKSWTLNQQSHPGTPRKFFVFWFLFFKYTSYNAFGILSYIFCILAQKSPPINLRQSIVQFEICFHIQSRFWLCQWGTLRTMATCAPLSSSSQHTLISA